MKILQVITTLTLAGAEKLVSEISPLMKDAGNTVNVCTFAHVEPNLNGILEDNGIKIINFGKIGSGMYNPIYIWKLAKLMKDYDIVNTHNTSPQYFVAIASLFSKKPKLVYTEHNTTNRLRKIPGFSIVIKWINNRYDKIICISEKAEQNLNAYLPSLKNLCTINNGIDVSKFRNAKPIENLRTSNKKVILMVASFRKQKDHATLIKAFAKLRHGQYELWLVGQGETREQTKVLCNKLNVSEYVRFFDFREDIPELLHTADIIVMSSHYEGLSLSSVEGMAVGKPFIASNVDGLREVVEGYGVLVPHEDPNALAEEIVRLTENHDYYKKVADKCWERAQIFDIKKMVDGYLEVYKNLLR